jgi:hypothetical protein
MVHGNCGGSGYGSGGGEVRSFNSFMEYYPYIRRKSIIIKNCAHSFVHRTLVPKKKTSLQSFVHRTSVPQKTVMGTIYRGCILFNI